jgi:glycine/D-amino acid oxidase-like deaminating enzyme
MNSLASARVTWDVCVVGGGPAGSAAAIRLARLGHTIDFWKLREPTNFFSVTQNLNDVLGATSATTRDPAPLAVAGYRGGIHADPGAYGKWGRMLYLLEKAQVGCLQG